MAAAGRKLDEREYVRLLLVRCCCCCCSGDGEAGRDVAAVVLLLLPIVGVAGVEDERSLDRDALRDGSNSSGWRSLCFRFLNRPPRTVLIKVNWSRISSRAGFHSNRRFSSETTTSGLLLSCHFQNVGINFIINSSGISRRTIATGTEITPSTRPTAHWGPLMRLTEKASPPTKMIKIWPPTMMNWMPMNQ